MQSGGNRRSGRAIPERRWAEFAGRADMKEYNRPPVGDLCGAHG
jgi:hypothetical protein